MKSNIRAVITTGGQFDMILSSLYGHKHGRILQFGTGEGGGVKSWPRGSPLLWGILVKWRVIISHSNFSWFISIWRYVIQARGSLPSLRNFVNTESVILYFATLETMLKSFWLLVVPHIAYMLYIYLCTVLGIFVILCLPLGEELFPWYGSTPPDVPYILRLYGQKMSRARPITLLYCI